VGKAYKDFELDDFILDESFNNWIFHPNQESNLFWEDFITKYPEKSACIREACWILKSIKPYETDLPYQRLARIKNKLDAIGTRKRKIFLEIVKVAAVFLFMATISLVIYNSLENRKKTAFETIDANDLKKGRIILSDGDVHEFDSKQTTIKQTSESQFTLNNDTIQLDYKERKSDQTLMNKVIIPYGMRSMIELADGTRIWLNSGSQLIYPAVFNSRKREVYLSGEAFFVVQSDSLRPFHVITPEMEFQVLGTSFNVSCYHDDNTVQAVLVSGKILARENKRVFPNTYELKPSERISFNKEDKSIVTDHVDVSLYASWVEGYLILEMESIGGLFKKLERYYNRKIVVNSGPENIIFSGKLNLAEDIHIILKYIACSIRMDIREENEIIHINLNCL
jgi:hypothetical protein